VTCGTGGGGKRRGTSGGASGLQPAISAASSAKATSNPARARQEELGGVMPNRVSALLAAPQAQNGRRSAASVSERLWGTRFPASARACFKIKPFI
jgi:hypothetical protein